MKPKNTICLWFDKDAHKAALFYAATFPDSKVTAVHKAPSDFPGGKKGDELTVEFTVLGQSFVGRTRMASFLPTRFCWYLRFVSVVTKTSKPSRSAHSCGPTRSPPRSSR
jgi:predicted 3-demethylubiquinone-9 3-methyltransferase (glyoxalase superfamily)